MKVGIWHGWYGFCDIYPLLLYDEVWIKRYISFKVYGTLWDFGTYSKVIHQHALLTSMYHIYSVFHVLLLHKYISDSTHVLKAEDAKLKDNLIYEDCLIHILDR